MCLLLKIAFSSKMHIILGLQLVLLINLSQSFVLLTANMEDVRKLARKFVSESLAEQIADFIAKISTNTNNVANVSEENEQNEAFYPQMSIEDDFKQKKIARHRSPKIIEPQPLSFTTATTKYIQITTENTKRPYRQNKKYRPKKTKQGLEKQQSHNKWSNQHQLPENPPDLNQGNENVKIEPQKIEEYHQEMSADAEPLQNLQVSVKNTKERRKRRKKQTNQTPHSLDSNIDSTIGYAERYELKDNHSPSRHRFVRVDSKETNYTYIKNISEATNAKYEGFNIDTGGQDLTTEKDKNQFDQYDIKQYPKSEFIATSGPVALPKMPSQSEFWDKEISEIERSKEHSRKRKAWF